MLKTAEAVSPKHPDKLCDQISDAILDECLKHDPNSRVAIETMGGHGLVTITGELTTNAYVDMHAIAKSIVGKEIAVQTNIVKQSNEIAQGVDGGGAGDQGIMVGYACDENPAMIPQEIYLAKSLCKFLYDWNPQDGKTQITLDDNGKIMTIVASWARTTSIDLKEKIYDWLRQNEKTSAEIKFIYCNPAGDWNQSGFDADTGLTGRKIAVDNYGPQIPIGGGAFSGKDGTKVDRSGAYIARFIAKNILFKLNLYKKSCTEVVVSIAYAIGHPYPVMVTAKCKTLDGKWVEIKNLDQKIALDLSPLNVIEMLNLRSPIFKKTAEWGAFLGQSEFVWEEIFAKEFINLALDNEKN